jgi:hypothetical protein
MDEHTVRQVRKNYSEMVLGKANVVGVGTGYKSVRGRSTDELCVVALVRRKIPRAGLDPKELIPTELDGVSTDVQEIGEPRAFQARTDRWRPAPGGVSLGHFQVTAGTFGAIVRDRTVGDRLILSNNHVLANSNAAQPGDAILQPGAADGGWEDGDTIARLERFCPIVFSSGPPTCSLANAYASFGNIIADLVGSKHRVQAYWSDPQAANRVDAAVARPLNDLDVLDEILDIGEVSGTTPAQLGMTVRKSGRTTGFTTGQITVLDTTVDVRYGDSTARFEGQIVSTPMSQPGDSGSLLVAGNSLMATGLLFAGSEQATIFNPIEDVLTCLDVVI